MSTHPPILASPIAARQDVALAARRPASWRQILPGHRLPVVSKTALLIALGVYLSGGTFRGATVGVTMLLGAALWFDLYILNEATDVICEQKMRVSGPILCSLFVVPLLLCAAAYRVFPSLALSFALMAASQFAYCVPPLRLKRYWWTIILLSGTLNPVLRLQCGVELGAHGLTPLVYAAFISVHIGAALRARVLLRERDGKFGYRPVPAGAENGGEIVHPVRLSGRGGTVPRRGVSARVRSAADCRRRVFRVCVVGQENRFRPITARLAVVRAAVVFCAGGAGRASLKLWRFAACHGIITGTDGNFARTMEPIMRNLRTLLCLSAPLACSLALLKKNSPFHFNLRISLKRKRKVPCRF